MALVLAALCATFPFNDPALPLEERVEDLLARLTLEEQMSLLYMNGSMAYGNDTIIHGKAGDLPNTNLSRLGIPMFHWMGQGSVYRGAANGCNVNCCSGNVPPGNCASAAPPNLCHSYLHLSKFRVQSRQVP